LIVVVAPVPAIAPGLIVQLPAGRLLRITLPVATAHVGCVIVPTVGVPGVTGWELTVTGEGVDVQELSAVLLTITLCKPAATPAKVVEACHAPPSMLYSKAPSGEVTTIVAVVTIQVGCVVLRVAEAGGEGCALMITLAEAGDVHPDPLVTVKL
jgi:hypothetical protein